MRSHTYKFTARQLAGVLMPTLAVLALLAVLFKSGDALRWLPPRPANLDSDRLVLAHQAAAAHSHQPAQVILLGDSTCLMGVDAAELERRLPNHPPVLSLALFIWLGFNVYGDVLGDYANTNPDQVRAVVLLVTPSKLVGNAQSTYAERLWQQVQSHQAGPEPPGSAPALADWIGARLLRERLVSRLLDTPLHGGGAAYFGFVSRIEDYMTAHQGSLVEFGVLRSKLQTNSAPWNLTPGLEPETRSLRSRLPGGAKLFIGLTPGPQAPGLPANGSAGLALLRQWDRWLGADALLTNLPPSLPEVCFSPSGHLNQSGQARFTAALARELAPLLR